MSACFILTVPLPAWEDSGTARRDRCQRPRAFVLSNKRIIEDNQDTSLISLRKCHLYCMWFLFVLFFHIASMTLERMTFTTASPAMTTETTSTRTSSKWKLDSPWWVRRHMVHACVREREDGKGCHYPTAVRELTCHAYVCCFASSMLQIRYMQVSVALYRTLLSKAPSSAPLSFPVNVCRLKPLRPVCLYKERKNPRQACFLTHK